MIRLLTFTNLYPSEGRPRHGIFVEQRLRRLVESGRVRAHVLVPVPRAPWGAKTALPARTTRHGIPVSYCGFPAVRGLTTLWHPRLMARAARHTVAALRRAGEIDAIDAHFLYPDGVAAAHLAAEFALPFVMTARGSDVNVALRERVAGRSIRWAGDRAAAIIAVSAALRDSMIAQGLLAERITVLRNGVDLELFKPGDRPSLRAELGFTAPTLLAVGNLVVEKGFDLVLGALTKLPEVRLVVLGAGPMGERLRAMAGELGVARRVTWLSPVPQAALARYYSAADVTVLASTREGMPNVLLESLACGTPVVATHVGGAPEIVTEPIAGGLVRDRLPTSFAAACRVLLDSPPDRLAVRRFGARFGWESPIAGQLALFERVAGHA